MNLLTIVIPCYNEINSLPPLIEKLKEIDLSLNFLIIDNGSSDGSRKYLNKINSDLPSNIDIFYIQKNKGYGSGVLEGLKSIKDSKYIGWIHGDLQFDFSSLNHAITFLNSESHNNRDIFYKGVRTNRKIIDKLFSKVMGIAASIIFTEKFNEINAQPTLFSKNLLSLLKNPPSDFSFDTYVYWVALKNNYKIKRGLYEFPPRIYGESKWNFGIMSRLKFSKQLFMYFLELRKSKENKT